VFAEIADLIFYNRFNRAHFGTVFFVEIIFLLEPLAGLSELLAVGFHH